MAISDEEFKIITQKVGECKWLHISDMHMHFTNKQHQSFNTLLYGRKGRDLPGDDFESGGLRWVLKREPVDFILFTGDFFDKGQIGDVAAMKTCLTELYDLCARMCGWKEWVDGDKKTFLRLFYCPGNHDLNRNACKEQQSVSLIRNEFLENESLIDSNGCFVRLDEDVYKLMTERAFGGFYGLLEEWTASHPMILSGCHAEYKYEYRLFPVYIQGKEGDKPRPIVFCGINTALLAGHKSRCISPMDIFLMDVGKHRGESIALDDSFSVSLQNLVRKQVPGVRKQADTGKLCFISNAAQIKIREELEQFYSNRITMLTFGHHPVSSLNQASKEAFANFLQNNSSQIYLCGHAHLPSSEDKPFAEFNSNGLPVKQYSVANFGDARYEEEFFGFSISHCKVLTSAKCEFNILSYVFLSRGGTHFWSRIEQEQIIDARPASMPNDDTALKFEMTSNEIGIKNTDNVEELNAEKLNKTSGKELHQEIEEKKTKI